MLTLKKIIEKNIHFNCEKKLYLKSFRVLASTEKVFFINI